MLLNRKAGHQALGLQITPLIDVVFMLLVFFMLATNFARYRLIGVESPVEREVAQTAEGAIVIELLADGSLRFDGRPAPRDALAAQVAAVIRLDPNRQFLLRPNTGVSLQDAVTAHDEARDSGARYLSFSRSRDGAAP
ncbi:MAG: ExbD/TolR family protein [Thermaurantiacus sp.]